MNMKRAAALLLLLLAFACPAMAHDTVIPDINPETKPPDAMETAQPESIIAEGYATLVPKVAPTPMPWLYPIALSILEDPLDVLRLVNKANLLDDQYPPEDVSLYTLVECPVSKASSSKMLSRQISADALSEMFQAAEADSIKLYVTSAYRSYQTQSTMHYNRLKSMNGKDDGMVQMAGASDHQTGLGFDIVSATWRDRKLNADFAKTKEAQWMAENCARFGFIIRYPEGKYDITGIHFEPWHLRYVGREVAIYMTTMGLTLEEFTTEWKSVKAEYDMGIVYGMNIPTTEDTFVF